MDRGIIWIEESYGFEQRMSILRTDTFQALVAPSSLQGGLSQP